MQPDGTRIFIIRGGVHIISRTPNNGIVDIESELAVIWKHPDPKKGEQLQGPNGEWYDKPNQPMEVYLEGDVILRQDEIEDRRQGRSAYLPRQAGLTMTSSATGSSRWKARSTSSPRGSSRP